MKTSIRWTEFSWNWAYVCSRDGAPCANCYAIKLLRKMGANPFTPWAKDIITPGMNWNPAVTVIHRAHLEVPLHLRDPRVIFVNSLGDTFHDRVPEDAINRAFEVMRLTPRHTYQILTKRPQRMLDYLTAKGPAPDHVWCGTSVGDLAAVDKLDVLVKVPAKVRWISIEPLVGDLAPTPEAYTRLVGLFRQTHWIVLGAESGPRARRMQPDWARKIRDAAREAGVPLFFKQQGMFNQEGVRQETKHFLGFDLLDGVRHMEYPKGFEVPDTLKTKHGGTPTPTQAELPLAAPAIGTPTPTPVPAATFTTNMAIGATPIDTPTRTKAKDPKWIEAGRKAWATRRVNLARKGA